MDFADIGSRACHLSFRRLGSACRVRVDQGGTDAIAEESDVWTVGPVGHHSEVGPEQVACAASTRRVVWHRHVGPAKVFTSTRINGA